jgi:membrane fusion protein, copper/silver efflux system
MEPKENPAVGDNPQPAGGTAPDGPEAPSPKIKKHWFGRLFLLAMVLAGGIAIGKWVDTEALLQGRFALRHEVPREMSGKVAPAPPREKAPSGERKPLYWVDPMNPSHKSDKPGKAPDGMDLVPVYAEEGTPTESLPPGSVQIKPQRQQLIGVQYGEVTEGPVTKTIRAVGMLASDETKIAHIHTKFEGWIEETYIDFVGMLVEKGQPLLSIYSPELYATQQELLLAKKSKETLADNEFKEIGSGAVSLYQATRARLKLWDIPDREINAIEKRGAPMQSLKLYSPIKGFVQVRNAFPGLRVTPDTELYTVVDLSNIWVFAEVYEYELPMVQVGQQAKMSLTYYPGETFTGKITYIYPRLNAETRTLKVRLEFPNRDYRLKPDMYANVVLEKDLGVRISVPSSAVLDSGTEQIVFVALDNGYFEPRAVKIGPGVEGRYIIQKGLKPGERIVVSGNFLVDSESKLKSAVGAMGGHAHGGGAPGAAEEKKPLAPTPSKETPPGQPDHAGRQEPSTMLPGPPPGSQPTPFDHSQHQAPPEPTTRPDHSQRQAPSPPAAKPDHSSQQMPSMDMPGRAMDSQGAPPTPPQHQPPSEGHTGHSPHDAQP